MSPQINTIGGFHPAGSLPRPSPADVWIEGPSRQDLFADPRWDTPGVYPFMRSGLVKDPAKMAQGLTIGNRLYCSNFRDRWAKAGKALKCATVIIPSLSPDQSPYQFADHPNDFPQLGMFYRRGPGLAAAHTMEWAPDYADAITNEGLAKVAAILCDCEWCPNTNGLGPQGPGTNDPSKGFIMRALADPRAQDSSWWKGLGQSLALWCRTNSRGTLLNGDPIPAIPARVQSPNVWDSCATGYEARDFATTNAFRIGFADPIMKALGCRFGLWQTWSRSRAFPVEINPGQFSYNLQGDFPLGLQVPVNYCCTPGKMDDSAYANIKDGDKRWPIANNWITARAATIGLSSKLSRHEQWLRTAFDVNIANARAMSKATPDAPLFPCIMADFKGGYNQDPITPQGGNDGYDDLRMELMVEFCYQCSTYFHAAGFWYWAPDWDNNSAVREWVWKFVNLYRRRCGA